jgi:hypothetical protein
VFIFVVTDFGHLDRFLATMTVCFGKRRSWGPRTSEACFGEELGFWCIDSLNPKPKPRKARILAHLKTQR